MLSVIIEIRSAEGGDDSKLLIREQLTIYIKFAVRQELDLELLDERPGRVTCRLSGPAATINNFSRYEVGGMRWQRIPPTERKGRVHTSTVTVAVLPEEGPSQIKLADKDLDIRCCRGSGAGGQHRNTTDSAVQVTHLPTGLQVRVESERSQHQNRESALALLRMKLQAEAGAAHNSQQNSSRKAQVGVGARGDKVVTISIPRDSVIRHGTEKRTTYKRYSQGYIDDLW